MAIAENNTETIVAIAAEGEEFAGLLTHAAQPAGDGGLRVAFSRKASLAGRNWLLVANGPGPALATEACRAALASATPAALISTGFCGAVAPDLPVGDVFVARSVHTAEEVFPTRTPQTARPHRSGVLASADRVVTRVEERRALHEKGIDVVDMEAGAVAQFASEHRLPFYCVRVVSDTAADTMPLDFNRYRDTAGRFDRVRIGRAAALRPWVIPSLLRLRRHCGLASKELGDFLVHCSFVQ